MTIASVEEKLPRDWAVIVFMTAIHLGALLAFLPGNFSWAAVGLTLFLHWLTGCLGITLGWHRLVSHRSFQTPKWLEYVLVFCGTLSMQGGPIWWVGLHRHHHLYSDQSNDHHDSNKGFWWSHMGWMLREVPAEAEVGRFTKDIADDPFYQFCDKYFLPIQIAFGVLLYLIGGWSFVVWGIFVRLVLVYHATWFINSATHKFGYRTYDSNDKSTNCWWAAVLAYGEGWHNNHHAFQYSARHGLKWWEVDMTWWMVCTLKTLGLATKVKVAEP
ncbi:MAG TPA: acyl-CoA desaturase [Trichocoleus sp.]|jgi:stearoyl-CoA desaturase (delta-9 desaturase)